MMSGIGRPLLAALLLLPSDPRVDQVQLEIQHLPGTEKKSIFPFPLVRFLGFPHGQGSKVMY